MFTGIIEESGTVIGVQRDRTNINFDIRSRISKDLKVDQSVSHNGVCLTVVAVNNDVHTVTAIEETLLRSNLGAWKEGSRVNLERCMISNGRFDGHIVQGHVDQTGMVELVQEVNGSWLFDFSYDASLGHVTVEKGSICVNGVSLTCFNSTDNSFRVAIIPYTFEHTNFGQLKKGDRVNLEFDIVGKYIQKLLERSGKLSR